MNFDFSYFHPTCDGVTVVSGADGIYVFCPKCRVAANLEAVSAKISPADAVKVGLGIDRVPTGKLSGGIER